MITLTVTEEKIAGHIQSLVAASDDIRKEVEKFKNAFTLAADKVRDYVFRSCCSLLVLVEFSFGRVGSRPRVPSGSHEKSGC